MPAERLGVHIPSKGTLANSLRAAHAMGCTAVQVFTASPRMWRHPEPTPEAVADFRRAMDETGLRDVVSHDSYLVNLIAPDEAIAEKSFASLTGEMNRCGRYGIAKVVSHLGSYKGRDPGECLLALAKVVVRVLETTDASVSLLMETTAGQGSSVNSRFEEMAMLLELTHAPARLGVCLDTCHVFAAGYDLRTPEGYEAMWQEFDRMVGRDRLLAIHCNDSMKPLGSRVDRHADIGQGEIGEAAFRCLVNDERLRRIPILLETDAERHAENLDRLKSYWNPN